MSTDLIRRVREHLRNCSLPIGPPVPPEEIEQAESRLGFAPPELLVRLYTEIANGGFGPGYGLIGLVVPHKPDGQTVLGLYQGFMAADTNPELDVEWYEGVLPFCDWGCGIYTCLDCLDEHAPILTWDQGLTWTDWTLQSWLEDWVDGVNMS